MLRSNTSRLRHMASSLHLRTKHTMSKWRRDVNTAYDNWVVQVLLAVALFLALFLGDLWVLWRIDSERTQAFQFEVTRKRTRRVGPRTCRARLR